MNISDLIADTLLQLLKEQNGTIQIQRNDFANTIGCVPSQINYVISSRFTKEQGYIVESRRGGGGFIKLIKIETDRNEFIFYLINSIGECLDETTAKKIIENLYEDQRISKAQALLMLSCVLEDNFRQLNELDRKIVRSHLVKSMLLSIIS